MFLLTNFMLINFGHVKSCFSSFHHLSICIRQNPSNDFLLVTNVSIALLIKPPWFDQCLYFYQDCGRISNNPIKIKTWRKSKWIFVNLFTILIFHFLHVSFVDISPVLVLKNHQAKRGSILSKWKSEKWSSIVHLNMKSLLITHQTAQHTSHSHLVRNAAQASNYDRARAHWDITARLKRTN